MATARDAILRRIREGLGDVPAGERPEGAAVPRDYQHASTDAHPALVERFIDRVSDYGAALQRVSVGALPQAIADACARRSVRRLVLPADVPSEWVALLDGVELLRDGPDSPLSVDALDSSDGALTGCALAIAQTGSLVLDTGPAQGRRALTLVPDYHLCVLREDQIVGIVPEAVAALGDSARERRPITFVSGPSATVDIEFQRVQGVHGPRTLDILLVGQEAAGAEE